MEDLSRHLPLSHRSGVDESGATTDRRADIALVRERQAEVVAQANPARADQLRAEAAGVRSGRRSGIRQLAEAVRELAVELGSSPLELPAHITGAVALFASTRAPFERRAVVRGHTLRAVAGADAPGADEGADGRAGLEWEFGHGPALEGTADEIVRFLLGLSDVAPRSTRRPR